MWPKKSFYLSIFALLAVLFGSCIITSSDVSAVSDLSVTTSSWSANEDVFPNCDSSCLSQYHFLTISSVSPSGDADLWFIKGSGSNFLHVTFPNFNGNFSLGFSLTFPFDFPLFKFRHTKSTGSFTFTLSEYNPVSFSSESEPCPEIPDNPYDDKLDSIRNAIILVPAVCLLLYFFYVIFGIIIPTTGGKK